MAPHEIKALVAAVLLLSACGPRGEWRSVPMDGHRSGVVSLTEENLSTGLGIFRDSVYVMPSGAEFPADGSAAAVASALMAAQKTMGPLKVIVGHCARMMDNLRDNPDLPLGDLVADMLRERASLLFGVKMDVAITNFGGIRVPMPEGDVTLDDIMSMFPFQNYLCHVRITGENLLRLLEERLAPTKAFQATSGLCVRVRAHKIESVLVGGEPVDPARVYHLATIDFLLGKGDDMYIGDYAESVEISKVLIRDAMLEFIRCKEAAGEVLDAAPDGRVIMED